MIMSQMGVTSDPQDLWRMGMMVGCDGTLEEDGEHKSEKQSVLKRGKRH